MKFVIVTGLSGAGKTTALKILENMGFYCVDNLPSVLLTKFADLCFQENNEYAKVAVGIDARGREYFYALGEALEYLENKGADILFLSCNHDELVNRYNFTRHVHPLAEEGTVLECIEKEEEILKPIKSRATYLIDTSNLNSKGIKAALNKLYGEKKKGNIKTYLTTFGFKRGVPMDADFIFDVRFLPNPYNIQELREHSGLEETVLSYLSQFEDFTKTVNLITEQLAYVIPRYEASGKAELNYAIGCTGGFHRSVAVAEAVKTNLERLGFSAECEHRDFNAEQNKN